jgi:cell division transport system ATP-binding protein
MIKFENVSMVYANGNHALNDVSLQIDDGEFVFITGRSGAGKTTLTKLLICEERVSSGRLEVNGFRLDKIRSWRIPKLRRTMGVVFQDFKLFDKMTVYENVAFAMRVIGAKEKEIKERVPYVLELVGLENKANRHPGEMSGGEQQRLAIARALVNNPSMLIADEPTGNLDPARSFEIMSLLQEINSLGTTVLVVTHAQNLVDRFRKRCITIDEGVVVSDKREEDYHETK